MTTRQPPAVRTSTEGFKMAKEIPTPKSVWKSIEDVNNQYIEDLLDSCVDAISEMPKKGQYWARVQVDDDIPTSTLIAALKRLQQHGWQTKWKGNSDGTGRTIVIEFPAGTP